MRYAPLPGACEPTSDFCAAHFGALAGSWSKYILKDPESERQLLAPCGVMALWAALAVTRYGVMALLDGLALWRYGVMAFEVAGG